MSALVSVLVWLSPVPAALAQVLPAMGPQMMELQRCRELTDRTPQQSLALADAILARPSLDPVVHTGALGCRMVSQMLTGQREAAQATANELQATLDRTGLIAAARINALLDLARVSAFLDQPHQAIAQLDQALALGEKLGAPTVRLNALMGLAITHAEVLHDPAGAEPYFQQAIAIIESVSRPPLPQDAGLYLGYTSTLLERGLLDQAQVQIEKIERIAKSMQDIAGLQSRAAGIRAVLDLERGHFDQARSGLEKALDIQRRTGDRVGEFSTTLFLAKLDLKTGHPQRALDQTTRILEIAERGDGGPVLLFDALRQMAEIQHALGNAQRAAEYETRLRALAPEAPATGLQKLQERAQAPVRGAREELAWHQREFARNSLLAVLVLLVLGGGIALVRLRRRQRRLVELGSTDPLTGLLNRREAGRRIQALLPAHDERRHAVLLIDVDRFKTINDRRGHLAGDDILTRIAAVLRDCCDDDDIVARWGGEEFLVVRPSTRQDAAFALAEHLRERIQQAGVLPGGDIGVEVTASVGVAPFPFFPGPDGGGWQDAVGLSDRALYVAKHAGRNAWAGLWGLAEGGHADLREVRRDPEAALTRGWIATGGNRPMSWAPVHADEDQTRPPQATPGPRRDDRQG